MTWGIVVFKAVVVSKAAVANNQLDNAEHEMSYCLNS